MAKAIMIQGAGSNVGKSMVVAGLPGRLQGAACRWSRSSRRTCPTMPPSPRTGARSAAHRRCRPWPVGRAPHTDMNPVLLKPESEIGAQVILNGQRFRHPESR